MGRGPLTPFLRSFLLLSAAASALLAGVTPTAQTPSGEGVPSDRGPGHMPSAEACFPRVTEGSARLHGAAGSEWFGSLQWGAITADGTWVVADGRRTALHLIRPGGSHRMVGRRGDGPGEFRSLSRLWVTPGNTISVFDIGSGRVTSLSSDGEILESRLFPFQEFPRGIMGEVSSGGVLLQRTVTRHGVPGTGLFRDSLELVVTRDGQEQVVLGPLPGSDRYLEGFPVFPVPFGLRVTYRLVDGRHLLVAPGERAAYLILDRDGEVRQRLVLPASVPPHDSPFLAADASTALFRAEDEAGTPLLLVMDRECEAG